MSKLGLADVGLQVERIMDGSESTAPEPPFLRDRLIHLSSRVVQSLGSGRASYSALADLLATVYHLGRRQALERVAIGLDSVAMQTPEPKGCDLCDGSEGGHHPDCARIDPVGQDHDPYPNVPIEDEEVCLGDEPRPPQSFPRGTPPPDTVKNPARGA